MANMLQLKNVTVSYKNVPTVQNFNLDMKQGQIVSLVGCLLYTSPSPRD